MPKRPAIMQQRPAPQICQQVDVLLFDQFSNHCLANAIEPLRAANGFAGKALYRWSFLGIKTLPVVSSSGLPVMPSETLSRSAGGACLIVMPSYHFQRHTDPATLRALRAAAGRYDRVIGMDTGAWLLAAAGLLDGRRATIHWDELGNFAEAFPEVDVVADRFVIDKDRACCGGATTAFDLILHLIRDRHGPMLTLEVASMFIYAQGGRLDEKRYDDDELVHAAVSLMRQAVEVPVPVPALAATLGVSRKQLEARFRHYTNATPQGVYRLIRLREAKRMAGTGALSIGEIATRCGYANAAAMTRAFKREFDEVPSAYRRKNPASAMLAGG